MRIKVVLATDFTLIGHGAFLATFTLLSEITQLTESAELSASAISARFIKWAISKCRLCAVLIWRSGGGKGGGGGGGFMNILGALDRPDQRQLLSRWRRYRNAISGRLGRNPQSQDRLRISRLQSAFANAGGRERRVAHVVQPSERRGAASSRHRSSHRGPD